MEEALQFGAGNIGRGFMAQLFFEAGYHTLFVESDEDLARLINERDSYTLHLLDAYTKRKRAKRIDNIAALNTSQTDDVARAFARARVVGTAVGVENLSAVARLVASGIRERFRVRGGPVDIFLCENRYQAFLLLRDEVLKCLDAPLREWTVANVGFVGTSVARMVPAPDERLTAGDPLAVAADSFQKLPYDGASTRATRPPIEGMYPVTNFRAEVERKLFTHNLGHAALGYIGYLKGFSYVHEALADPYLAGIFGGALEESGRALLAKYRLDLSAAGHREVVADVRVRFSNPMLRDRVERVARDPIRKLSPEDRLIGAARLCLDQGVFPEHVALVCGAALNYDAPGDAEAQKLVGMIRTQGVEKTLCTVSGVEEDSELGALIAVAYHRLRDLRESWVG